MSTEAIAVFAPLSSISKKALSALIIAQVVTLAIVWVFSPFALLPKPMEVGHQFALLWADGLGTHLIVSFIRNLEAIAWSVGISLGLVYLTVIPFFRPIVAVLGKLRFLSMVGLSLAFANIMKTQGQVEIAMLVFSICVFLITSLMDVLDGIPKEQYDLARTLRMSKRQIVWEVVIRGQIDKVFDCLRQNVAIGWMMLTMVESVNFSGGGVGTVLMTQQHHMRLEAIMAIQLTILLVGLGQDYLLGVFKNACCPYAKLVVEKR
jgi:NitT/TauT family transport system permease protein